HSFANDDALRGRGARRPSKRQQRRLARSLAAPPRYAARHFAGRPHLPYIMSTTHEHEHENDHEHDHPHTHVHRDVRGIYLFSPSSAVADPASVDLARERLKA